MHRTRNTSDKLTALQTVITYLGSVCSRTQLCRIGVFIDYIKQLHVSAFSGHLQVVLREQT